MYNIEVNGANIHLEARAETAERAYRSLMRLVRVIDRQDARVGDFQLRKDGRKVYAGRIDSREWKHLVS